MDAEKSSGCLAFCLLTMPLFFASNAIYPLAIVPAWLHVIARLTPLSYEVDALRALMITGGATSFGLPADFACSPARRYFWPWWPLVSIRAS